MASLPPDWKTGVASATDTASPGTGPLPPKPTAPLTTPTDPASAAASEAMWRALKDAPLDALIEVFAWLQRHPEVQQWAKVGRFNPTPGATP